MAEFYVAGALVFLTSYFAVLAATPLLIIKLRNMRIVSPDMNKQKKPLVPKIGGIAILLGFSLAALLSLVLYNQMNVAYMLAAICSVALISFLGLLDDILNIRDIYRVVLPLFAALPLMVVKAGDSKIILPVLNNLVDLNLGSVSLPLIGAFSLNLYVLLLIPIGVVACSNLINLLSGFNGLEAGTGAVACASLLLAALTLHSWGENNVESSFLLLAMLGACLAFLVFNWYPARIFPGNVTTYAIGAVIVSAVVLGNMERAGVIVLTPQIAEFFLKARSLFRAENYCVPKKGRLYHDGPIYSLTHLIMKYARPTERQLVLILILVQLIFGLLAVSSLYWPKPA
ncbi:MAG: hypothetical protein AB1468_02650 [Candidatus Micrarchaeota archaeon]